MKKILLIKILVLVTIQFITAQNMDYTKYVNPFIGTDGHGHTYPGVLLPFGMVQVSPDTRLEGWDGCSGYHYSDNVIYGFSHTHLSGTGCSDYGDILLMPSIGDKVFGRENYSSTFSHKNEKAVPGYYMVLLDKNRIEAELTATLRTGFHRYTFNKSDKAVIVLDFNHRDEIYNDSYIEVINNTEVRGMRRSKAWAENQVLYFVIRFSKPFTKSYCNDNGGAMENFTKIWGDTIAANFQFQTKNYEKILVKVGVSAVSIEGAIRNLETELPDWDFDKAKQSAHDAWNKELGKIEVKDNNKSNLTKFYTSLYHCFSAPNLYMDVDHQYRGRDNKIHIANGFDYYTVFSLWDTYRAEHPLFTIVDRKRTSDFVKTMLAQYTDGGMLPVWELSANETDCMIGYHSVSVITDAYMKGITDFDAELALKAMQNSANQERLGLKWFNELGYIPSEKEHESVSKSLEYAYDDWCIAQMARKMGKIEIYNDFIKRAQSYKNIFNPETGFMQARANGGWISPFRPNEVNNHYTEANSWQYSFYVPQDINGLINLYGGSENFAKKLDTAFTTSNETVGRQQADITGLIGQYAHGNEPSHHMTYLYAYADQSYKTEKLVRQIMNTLYAPTPDGLCGNEDCGQMSAWFVMSALGFYPVCPGNNEYIFGSPLFRNVKIHLENGKTFEIDAKDNSKKKFYVQSVKLNNSAYPNSYIKHEDIEKGGKLEFFMNSQPQKFYSISSISEINDNLIIPAPYVVSEKNVFKDSIKIELKSVDKNSDIFYSVNKQRERKYEQPFVIRSSSDVIFYALNKNGNKSVTVHSAFRKIADTLSITLLNDYNPQYSAGGSDGLIDGIRGEINWRTGFWQGYQSKDFEAVIDLKEIKFVKSVKVGFLQDVRSWIWMPSKLIVSISDDNVNYSQLPEIINTIPDNDYTVTISDLKQIVNQKTRYIKIKAVNYGKIPKWHVGYGGDAFIFTDEIIIE